MSKNIFFVSPIGSDDSPERKRSNQLMKFIINPVLKSLGYDEAIRVDAVNEIDNIDATVIRHLEQDELVIVDMTGHNPNVFYEFGYRTALNLPLIPFIDEDDGIPFDVTTLRTIKYSLNDLEKTETVKTKLAETIRSLETEMDTVEKDSPLKTNDSISATSLLSIQDKLDEIITLIEKRNDDEIDKISEQIAKYSKPALSDEAQLMQMFMPMLLKNPELADNLSELSDKFGNK
ncbi:hypothetical protein [Fructobacillus fructosus]|uniref:hypothetical protein n=1 Tax=Fructobacillus fructosus TaxID=1631 RepID=UPI002DAF989C|nr:Nucleoside 2-deoxyribosyltransferase (RCL) [Fructobacillus fructosus]CAK1251297.1 Nucleoside 2-deoxyribosyltransferase (RCL) [Fructobacillus fructosus]CAK1252843.1 Nucleoside 2-deoxyribosyltransferase (RCL) [Fructobacillus fructosus]